MYYIYTLTDIGLRASFLDLNLMKSYRTASQPAHFFTFLIYVSHYYTESYFEKLRKTF